MATPDVKYFMEFMTRHFNSDLEAGFDSESGNMFDITESDVKPSKDAIHD